MIEIKKIRPKESYKAVFVTKENLKEFLDKCYGSDYIGIEYSGEYAVIDYGLGFGDCADYIRLNSWYGYDTGYDPSGWEALDNFNDYWEVLPDE